MKHNVLLAALFLLNSTFAIAQTAQEDPVEQFLTSAGLVEQKITRVGAVRGIQVDVLKMKDLTDPGEFNVIRVSATDPGGAMTAVLDKAEADELVKALNTIEKSVLSSTPNEPTDVIFSGRSGIEVGCGYYPGKPVWRPYVKVQRGKSASVQMEVEELKQFIALVEQAHGKL